MKQIDLLRSVMSYLESKNILCFPTKSGLPSSLAQRKKFADIRLAGVADLLAFYESRRMGIIPVWLEIKSRGSKQTPDQKYFQAMVESKRHVYMVIRSVRAAREFFD